MIIFLKILFVIISFFLGSIPWGYFIGLLKGHNLLKEGSKNIGATNTGRILGKKYAIICFFLDFLKAAVPVALFTYKVIPNEYMVLSPILYGFMATLGHSFSPFLKFQGGKSVSCGIGALSGYLPYAFVIVMLFFLIMKKVTKLVSVASLSSGLVAIATSIIFSLCFNEFLVLNENFDFYRNPYNFIFVIGVVLIVALIYIKHIPNIKRILKGEEKAVNY